MSIRTIIANGDNYGAFNENQLATFCARNFINRIKSVHNQVDNIETTTEYKNLITNADTIDFEDVLPSTGISTTIYSIIDGENNRIYVYSGGMIYVGNIYLGTIQPAVTEVDELPSLHVQNVIYKIPNINALFWWNGSEYINISSTNEMVPVTTFPTGTDIEEGRLYKLTQNITHTGELQYINIELEYTEGTEAAPSKGYYHNTSTNEWYYNASSITIESDQTLPEPSSTTEGKYYLIGGDILYQCQLTRPVVVDYYSGIYVYMNNDWRSLYTSNLMVGYNTGIIQSTLPIINGKRVVGSHDIGYYGAVTEGQISGTYQAKDMTNPLYGYEATTIEGTLAEMNSKMAAPAKIVDRVATYNDLPSGLVSTDMGKVYIVDTDTSSGETLYNQMYLWNGTKWVYFGEAGADLSHYQKFTQVIDKFKAANPTLTFSAGSSVAVNDNFVLGYLEITLGNPVTDLQSADRTLLTIPNDVNISERELDCTILTHAGQITATEDMPYLPSSSGVSRENIKGIKGNISIGDSEGISTISEEGLVSVRRMRKIRPYHSMGAELLGIGWEYREGTNKYYHDGVEITPTQVSSLPEATKSNEGTFYILSSDINHVYLYLSTADVGTIGQISYIDGSISMAGNGQPYLPYMSKGSDITVGSTEEYWVLDDSDVSQEDDNYVLGYISQTDTIMQETKTVYIPIYKLKKISLTMNSDYLLACVRNDSDLHINTEGVVGDYTIAEDSLSIKHCMHNTSTYGINGTFSFTPRNNNAVKQKVRECYISGKSVKVPGNISIDKAWIIIR